MKTHEQQQKKVLSKFTILCWAAFIAIPGHMQPMGWTPLKGSIYVKNTLYVIKCYRQYC